MLCLDKQTEIILNELLKIGCEREALKKRGGGARRESEKTDYFQYMKPIKNV
jgi:hypothetical protein